jgi:hypothetical protein
VEMLQALDDASVGLGGNVNALIVYFRSFADSAGKSCVESTPVAEPMSPHETTEIAHDDILCKVQATPSRRPRPRRRPRRSPERDPEILPPVESPVPSDSPVKESPLESRVESLSKDSLVDSLAVDPEIPQPVSPAASDSPIEESFVELSDPVKSAVETLVVRPPAASEEAPVEPLPCSPVESPIETLAAQSPVESQMDSCALDPVSDPRPPVPPDPVDLRSPASILDPALDPRPAPSHAPPRAPTQTDVDLVDPSFDLDLRDPDLEPRWLWSRSRSPTLSPVGSGPVPEPRCSLFLAPPPTFGSLPPSINLRMRYLSVQPSIQLPIRPPQARL